jgi:hypothetical protein
MSEWEFHLALSTSMTGHTMHTNYPELDEGVIPILTLQLFIFTLFYFIKIFYILILPIWRGKGCPQDNIQLTTVPVSGSSKGQQAG